MVESDASSSPEKPPVSFVEALSDRRNVTLIVLATSGAILFGVLFGKSLPHLHQQLLAAIREIVSGFTQISEAGRDSQEHLQVHEPRAEIQAGYQLLWTSLLGVGMWGWMLIERGYRNADPTLEICLRRAGVLGLGFMLFYLAGFDLTYPKSFTAGGALPLPDIGNAWQAPAPNFLLQALAPLVILSALAGYAICGVRSRFLLALAVAVTLLLFPVIGSWLWSDGWLAQMKQTTPLAYPRDLAGAGVIHLLCGVIGIAMLAGSRWAAGEALPREKVRPERSVSAVFGLLLVQLAFIALIGASVAEPTGPRVAGALLEGFVAAAAGALVAGLARIRVQIRPLPHMLLFGSMGGWVIVSGGVGGFALWQTAMLGLLAGVIVVTGLALLDSLEMRDPFALAPVHFGCGAAGVMATCWSDWSPDWILQFVALIAITVPTLIIAIALVWIFVRQNRFSKRHLND